MANHVESVKSVADYLRGVGERSASERPQFAERMAEYAESLDAAAAEIARLMGLTSALPPDLGNIYDLPKELLDELSIAKGDELEDQLVTVINAYGGTASLDQILVGLYRRFRVAQKRRFLQNKLYRMEMVWSVGGRKGIYTTTKPEIEEHPEPEEVREAPVQIDDEIPF